MYGNKYLCQIIISMFSLFIISIIELSPDLRAKQWFYKLLVKTPADIYCASHNTAIDCEMKTNQIYQRTLEIRMVHYRFQCRCELPAGNEISKASTNSTYVQGSVLYRSIFFRQVSYRLWKATQLLLVPCGWIPANQNYIGLAAVCICLNFRLKRVIDISAMLFLMLIS